MSLLRFADLLVRLATSDKACFDWAVAQGHLDLLAGIVQVRAWPCLLLGGIGWSRLDAAVYVCHVH